MLVLSRKLGQQIQIGENIKVSVKRISKNLVQIGVDAPAEVTIHRSELLATNPTSAAEFHEPALMKG